MEKTKENVSILLLESVKKLEKLRDLICDGVITEKDIDLGLSFDLLKEIERKTEGIYDEGEDGWTGEKIYYYQGCFYSQITFCYYLNFDNVLKHHKKEGLTEKEIKDFNEELVIYYTDYPGEGEIFEK